LRKRRLTGRQQQILDYVVSAVQEKGYVPSVREIGAALGLRSPSTVHQHLSALEHKGCLRRQGERMRALEIMDKSLIKKADSVTLPLLGRVSAGAPSLAEEHIEEYVEIPPKLLGDVQGCFLLRVRGDSMVEAGILPGDLVCVRPQPVAPPGEIVVALIGEEATVKRLAVDGGVPVLLPANPAYRPIRKEFHIIGRVTALMRAYGGVQGWA
jgi:repressor LexA